MSKHTLTMVLRSFGLMLVVSFLISCGGGGIIPGTDARVIRPLPADFATRKAIVYSPYRTSSTDPSTVTTANIQQDIDLLEQGKFNLIRNYNSDQVAEKTLQYIRAKNYDIKMQLGVWLNSEKYATADQIPGIEATNQTSIANCIRLANAYPDIVEAVSVGNECLVSWTGHPISAAQVASYMAQVRSAITQPVTTDDNWVPYTSMPVAVLNQIDFAAIHTYSFLDSMQYGVLNTTQYGAASDWKQASVPVGGRAAAMMDAFIAVTKLQFEAVSSYLSAAGYGDLPIVITETGWKAHPAGDEVYRAHPVNQKMYYDRLNYWLASGSGPLNYFWFEAFDEPSKGSDDNWGVFNVSRQARYVIQDLYPLSQWEPGTYTLTDALYYIPTAQNPAITADRYTLYAETTTSGEARPPTNEPLVWQALAGTTASAAETSTTFEEGTKSMMITPNPQGFGWSMNLTLDLPASHFADDLPAFSSGYLNFSIKTTYPGGLEVGFATGDDADLTAFNDFIPLGSGNYGFLNDGAWHNVQIPISAILPWGLKPYWMTTVYSPFAVSDLTMVTSPFVISNGWTGRTPISASTTPIYVDNIYWSK